jgi:alkaline phosphatase
MNLTGETHVIYSSEEAAHTIIRWVESHSKWDDSVLIVSSDHGHYLVVVDPWALASTR